MAALPSEVLVSLICIFIVHGYISIVNSSERGSVTIAGTVSEVSLSGKYDKDRQEDSNLDMAPTSEAQKRALKRYKSTDQGKQKQQEAFERWVKNNPDDYCQQVKQAQAKYEQKTERKAAKAEWMKEHRRQQKLAKQQAAQIEAQGMESQDK